MTKRSKLRIGAVTILTGTFLSIAIGFQNCGAPFEVSKTLNASLVTEREGQTLSLSAVEVETLPPQLLTTASLTLTLKPISGIDASTIRHDCALDDLAALPCESPIVINDLSEGPHSIVIRAIHSSGVQATPLRLSWIVKTPNAPYNVPFLTINPFGGAATTGNLVPLDENGGLLADYSNFGQASGAVPIVEEYGAKWFANSGILAGMKQALPAGDEKRIRVYLVPVVLQSDSALNPFDISGAVRKSGRTGKYIKGLTNRAVSAEDPIGIAGKSAFADPEFFMSTLLTIDNVPAINPALTDFDPRKDPTIAPVYGISETTNPATVESIAATQTMHLLNGNLGVASNVMGGFDYHGSTRATADAQDARLGLAIGRAAKSALLKKTPLFIYVPTDGGNIGGVDGWGADRNEAAALMFVVVDPKLELPAASKASDYCIGYFFGVSAFRGYWQNDLQVDERSMAASAVLANYLVASGKSDIASLTENRITSATDPKYIRVGGRLRAP